MLELNNGNYAPFFYGIKMSGRAVVKNLLVKELAHQFFSTYFLKKISP